MDRTRLSDLGDGIRHGHLLAAGSFRDLVDRVHFAGYVFVGIIVAFLLLIFVGKKLLTRWESRHMRVAIDNADEDAASGMKD